MWELEIICSLASLKLACPMFGGGVLVSGPGISGSWFLIPGNEIQVNAHLH